MNFILFKFKIILMETMNNINTYKHLTNSQTYIFGKNDFSKLLNKTKYLNLDDLSYNDYSSLKYKSNKNNKIPSSNLLNFKKIFEKTFSTPLEQTFSSALNYQFYDTNSEKKNFQKIQPVNTIPNQKNKRSKSTIPKLKNAKFQNINYNLNINQKNKNNNINNNLTQLQEYVNKNFYKVFGDERNISNDKTYKILYQISKIKKNLKNNSPNLNKDIINRPTIQIKDPKIITEYNDNTLLVHRKIDNLMKPHKRNLSYLDTMNKSSIKINNNNFYQDKNILFNRNNNIKLRNYNNIAIPNFITYKNNIVHIKQKNLFNDPKYEVENYKNSFKSNKSKDFILQKYKNASKIYN